MSAFDSGPTPSEAAKIRRQADAQRELIADLHAASVPAAEIARRVGTWETRVNQVIGEIEADRLKALAPVVVPVRNPAGPKPPAATVPEQRKYVVHEATPVEPQLFGPQAGHGTRGGYAWHRKHRQQPCEPCTAANTEYTANIRAAKAAEAKAAEAPEVAPPTLTVAAPPPSEKEKVRIVYIRPAGWTVEYALVEDGEIQRCGAATAELFPGQAVVRYVSDWMPGQ